MVSFYRRSHTVLMMQIDVQTVVNQAVLGRHLMVIHGHMAQMEDHSMIMTMMIMGIRINIHMMKMVGIIMTGIGRKHRQEEIHTLFIGNLL